MGSKAAGKQRKTTDQGKAIYKQNKRSKVIK